jgi:four helix bundle protein
MYVYSFERLEVWSKSRILTKRIYELTQEFPDEEKFGLVTQLRRASISVCSTLLKGLPETPEMIRRISLTWLIQA